MKISNVSSSPQAISNNNASTPKQLSQLSEGNKFKATVVDIHPNQVTLELDSGDIVTAKSLVLPDARIGEEAIFSVRNNANGQILLEMVKPEGHLPINFIKEALANAGMYPTKENIELVNHLLKNEMPVDAETLQKAAFFKYSDGSLSMDRILFLLKENFEASPLSINTLNSIMDKTIKLDENLKNIIFQLTDEASSLPEHVKNEALKGLLGELTGKETSDQLKKMLESKLFINLNNDSLDELSSFYKEMSSSVDEAKKALIKLGINDDTPIFKELSNVSDNIQFMDQIKNYKEYMQIPILINNNQMQGELYIFKDGKKASKNFKEQASVLISMDYVLLGKVEIFINKNRNDLSFQIRSNNEKTLKLIGFHSQKLSEALSSKGYSISGFALKKLDEPFSAIKDISSAKDDAKPTKRFSFDMRV